MNKSYESDIQFPVFDLNHLITNFPLPIEICFINFAKIWNNSIFIRKGTAARDGFSYNSFLSMSGTSFSPNLGGFLFLDVLGKYAKSVNAHSPNTLAEFTCS
jgi:hypothetical protein